MLIQVGELAKRAGMTVRTLHHYEQTGLLTPSARSAAGYRLYNLAAVQRLHMIKALAQAGLELATIKDYLDRDASRCPTCWSSRSPPSTGSCKPSPRCASAWRCCVKSWTAETSPTWSPGYKRWS
jgi:DNA-binding transcriptional MerR regulator